MNELTEHYKRLYRDQDLNIEHSNYLKGIKDVLNYEPKVIYDIGSAVLWWTKAAKTVWPQAHVLAFEAVLELKEFYDSVGIDYALEVCSDVDDKEVIFYEHPVLFGGNSYYKENSKYSAAADNIYNKESEHIRKTVTIDTLIERHNFPLPDMVKIDVQGAELDILKGMPKALSNVKHLIVELQHVEYNIGAKQLEQSIPFIESLGFKLAPSSTIYKNNLNKYFSAGGPDADYHFIKSE